MAAIAGAGPPTRRDHRLAAPPGPHFSRASWLERIHPNGGSRSIWKSRAACRRSRLRRHLLRKPAPPPPTDPRPASAPQAAGLEAPLLAAKAYRPLDNMLEAEIRCAVPRVEVKPTRAPPDPWSGRVRRRLGARRRAAAGFGARRSAPRRDAARAQEERVREALSHMLVLTDARQVIADLSIWWWPQTSGSRTENISAYHSPDTQMSELAPHVGSICFRRRGVRPVLHNSISALALRRGHRLLQPRHSPPDATTLPSRSARAGRGGTAQAQTASRRPRPAHPAAASRPRRPEKDPREGDEAYEQAQRLMKAIDAMLQDAAKNRGEAKKLPTDKRLPR